jgi:FtsP/CotA-like multicopper oxidase with cupredoxin domain
MDKIKNIFWIAIAVAIVGYFIYKVARNSFTDQFMGDAPQRTKAVIIDEKNFMGNQPVAPEFSYSYQFVVNGEKYTGNAHDTNLKIGDTVEVEYNKDHPNINKPLHPKE